MVAVSIVINNYNYARYLPDALESALNQTHGDVQIVVVDDGSTDRSREIIRSYGARILPVFKENGGQASTFNAGLSASSGDAIIFLDADDLLEPTAAAHAAAALEDPDVVKVHWPLRMIDASGGLTGEIMPREPLPQGDFREHVIRLGPDSYLSMPTSGNAWSSKVLEKVGPVPEPEYRKGADGYLLTVTPLFGRIARIEEPQGRYRSHGENQFWSGATDQRIERSLQRYDLRAQSLGALLERLGVQADPAAWRSRNDYYQWMSRLSSALEQIRQLVPIDHAFILVDQNEWGSQPVRQRRALPYIERDGAYWGPPADDAAAVAELERMRGEGASHIIFGWPAFWWLEHYPGLAAHLRNEFNCVLENDLLIAFALL